MSDYIPGCHIVTNFSSLEKLFYFFPHHIIDVTYYTNPILNISEHCFNGILLLL